MRLRRTLLLGVAVATLILGSGAKGHKLVDRWSAPDFEHRRFQKLIVLAITHDEDVRKVFENRFVSHLRGKRIEGVTSYSLVPDLAAVDEPQRRAVLQAIDQEQIDGVISVRAVPLKGRSEAEWGESWRREVAGSQTIRELVEQSLPLTETKSKKYGVEVSLWDAGDGGRIWAARTDTYTVEGMRKGAADFVQFTMYALEIDDLIKGTTPYREPVEPLDDPD
jgi:hypothetical protein